MEQNPLYGMLKMMSAPDFDVDGYVESESFAGILENQKVMEFAQDECGEAACSYWRERGLIKELHDTESIFTKWASYLPVSICENPDRKYPLLFVLHGSGNPIILAESYGYTRIAAREELILIIPEDETAESIERLFAYAKQHYPVDWTRVYMVGYSLGGYMTQRHAMRWPERFAAVGSGGMLFANGEAVSITQSGQRWQGENITPQMVQHAAAKGMPAIICMGEQEVLGLVPVTRDEPINQWKEHLNQREQQRTGQQEKNDDRKDRIDLSSKNKIQSINNWRIVNGCLPICEENVRKAVSKTANIVEEKIGYPFERTEIIVRENRSHYIGDSMDADGNCSFRMVCLAKSPHWPSQALAELTWEFISQFALDPETGKSYKI